jgi:hypothetical protein
VCVRVVCEGVAARLVAAAVVVVVVVVEHCPSRVGVGVVLKRI